MLFSYHPADSGPAASPRLRRRLPASRNDGIRRHCERSEAISSPPPDGLNSRLLLGVFAQPLADILGAEDVAGRIGRDTFAARLVVVRVGARDEVFDRPVLRIADTDAAPAARSG